MFAYPDFTAAFDAALRGATLPDGATAVVPQEVERRFAVYRNNVAVSLTAALAKRFPVIERLVGEAFFGAMARIYAEAHRPQSPVLLAWGDSFAAFLADFGPLAAYPYMADVARIEYARGVAFHAADARSARTESFLDADPSRLTLRLHPSAQVIRCNHPAVSIWRHNQPGATPDSLTLAGSEIALILRDRSFDVPVFAIGEGDAELLDHLRRGATLTTAAELAQWAAPGHDAQPLIRHLMQMGAILDPKGDT
ncbi:DNA-binding domain-containing protein [Loktanella sp. DJP18]|uniref:HvfC/BufC N-terminal domain-containing protein n=1 Tax=Loktanella sp. DJP18 TaxID=3409788 RepID=UPI003BB791E8